MKTTLLQGDCLATLKTIPDQSVNCCVTSPPYFGLRDYGHDGQIGLEETPEAYVGKMVEVFREVRRVLRDDGTLWLNLGDSYNNRSCARKSSHQTGLGFDSEDLRKTWKDLSGEGRTRMSFSHNGMKEKDLIGIPWRVAFALQADGWYLRQDIIWHKPNPMPESVTDRCTKAHEYLFLLSKGPRYYFDSDAIKEPVAESTKGRLSQPNLANQAGSARVPGKTNGNMKAVGNGENRNRRSVWTVTTKPYKGAHFATYPPELIRPCILAGCPKGGTVLDPFGGSGTTAQVAIEEGRNAILCELNSEYLELARTRIAKTQPHLNIP
jgi:DNA modification methylase